MGSECSLNSHYRAICGMMQDFVRGGSEDAFLVMGNDPSADNDFAAGWMNNIFCQKRDESCIFGDELKTGTADR